MEEALACISLRLGRRKKQFVKLARSTDRPSNQPVTNDPDQTRDGSGEEGGWGDTCFSLEVFRTDDSHDFARTIARVRRFGGDGRGRERRPWERISPRQKFLLPAPSRGKMSHVANCSSAEFLRCMFCSSRDQSGGGIFFVLSQIGRTLSEKSS